MNTSTQNAQVIRFEYLNWVATPPLPRDREQSHRLHEPDHMVNTIDPISGRDIWNLAEHPSQVDGKLTIYFESEETKKEYEHTPVNHPYRHSIGSPSDDIDRGG
jgi:YHS domain-containing protein